MLGEAASGGSGNRPNLKKDDSGTDSKDDDTE
jgi:hypothetical protein